eukprot:1862095-Pleurochrysis_carterae.AAC.2
MRIGISRVPPYAPGLRVLDAERRPLAVCRLVRPPVWALSRARLGFQSGRRLGWREDRPLCLRLRRRSLLPKASAPLRRLHPERRAQPGHQVPRHRLRRVCLPPRSLAQRHPYSPPRRLLRLTFPPDAFRAARRSETSRLLAGRWTGLLLLPTHGAAPLAPTHCGSTA